MTPNQALDQRIRVGDPEVIMKWLDDTRPQEPDLLFKAAKALRNLMAYPDAIEICDRCLALDHHHVPALEQKALALARLDSGKLTEAQSLLQQAQDLAQGTGESTELQGRLHKEMWRLAWFEKRDLTAENAQTLARYEKDHLLAAIERYREATANTQAYYSAINASTLMTLAQCLGCVAEAGRAEWSAAIHLLRGIAHSSFDQELKKEDLDSESRYWALASRLEWLLTDLDARKNADPKQQQDYRKDIEGTLHQALLYAGVQTFLLDSTRQQFVLLKQLGVLPPAAGGQDPLETCLGAISRTLECLQHRPHPEQDDAAMPGWITNLLQLDKQQPKPAIQYLQKPGNLAVDFLKSLRVRFEPIEAITHDIGPGALLGFELLACDRQGRNYPLLRSAALASGLSEADFNLALFACGLDTATTLWDRLKKDGLVGEGQRPFELGINLEASTLGHPLFPALIAAQYTHGAREYTILELNEGFPEIPKNASRGQVFQIIQHACHELKETRNTHLLRIAFDDCNDYKLATRLHLEEICEKSKADFSYTHAIMSICLEKDGANERIPEALLRCAVGQRPFVIEGVEEPRWYRFLKECREQWPVSTAMQGWHIRLRDAWLNHFEPVDPTQPEKPKGYYLKPANVSS